MTPDTTPYAYLYEDGSYPFRADTLSPAMPQGTALVPLGVKREYMESAMRNVATGLFDAVLVDPSLSDAVMPYVGACSLASRELGRADCVTFRKGILTGDLVEYDALRAALDSRIPPSGELIGGVVGAGPEAAVPLYYVSRVCCYVQVVGDEISPELERAIGPDTTVGLVSPDDFLPQVCNIICPCTADLAPEGSCGLRVSFTEPGMEVSCRAMCGFLVEAFMKKVSEAKQI